MFETFFTTKMSFDKKKLEGRFSKISSRTGKRAKIVCASLFAALLLTVIAMSFVLAANDTKKVEMSNQELSAFLKRPIGSVMAEIDYADGEKLVFHYLNGFFVYDMENNEISHAINLEKLNIGYNMQGDSTLEVVIDENGKFSYLTTLGQKELIKDFDDYRIDLESGKIAKKEKPNELKVFSGYSELVGGVSKFNGWNSDRAVIYKGKAYALTLRDNVIGALEFVVTDENFDNAQYTYVFGKDYMNTDAQKLEKAKLYLKHGSQIAWEERIPYEINGEKLSELKAVLDSSISNKLDGVSEGNFEVIFVPVTFENDSAYYVFIYDNYTLDVLSCGKLDDAGFSKAHAVLANRVHNLEVSESELYLLTKSYLEKEFETVFSPYYDIQELVISGWNESEDGNEATFLYTMRHLNYNRDPDTVDYIKKAKENASNENYQKLYDDYLAVKEGNFEFKIVRDGEELKLYSNVSPKGIRWETVKISDYIMQ